MCARTSYHIIRLMRYRQMAISAPAGAGLGRRRTFYVAELPPPLREGKAPLVVKSLEFDMLHRNIASLWEGVHPHRRL